MVLRIVMWAFTRWHCLKYVEVQLHPFISLDYIPMFPHDHDFSASKCPWNLDLISMSVHPKNSSPSRWKLPPKIPTENADFRKDHPTILTEKRHVSPVLLISPWQDPRLQLEQRTALCGLGQFQVGHSGEAGNPLSPVGGLGTGGMTPYMDHTFDHVWFGALW